MLFTQGGSVCHWAGANCGASYTLYGPAGSTTVTVTDCCAGYPGNPSCLTDPTDSTCDWCAANSHSHFDLDVSSFERVCGSTNLGHCQLSQAIYNGGAAGIVADATAINANPANLSVTVIIVIVVGAVVGVALLVGIIVFLMKRSNQTEIV